MGEHRTGEHRTKVLVVDDEESFVDALVVGLGNEGFEVEVARNGTEALEKFAVFGPDIVLLDVILPEMSGVDVCRELRRQWRGPIIMVTARTSEIDAVVGLEVGADDYISKPYRLRELVARMRAVRRRSATAAEGVAVGVLQVGSVCLDVDRHEVLVRGQSVALPLKEFELLAYFLANPGKVLTRDLLIRRVWSEDYVGDTKTLDVHIKRLRAKVEEQPSEPTYIKTVRGLGYKFDPSTQ